jgi:hypothetical protein
MKTMMNPITQSWEQVKPKNVLSALDRTWKWGKIRHWSHKR